MYKLMNTNLTGATEENPAKRLKVIGKQFQDLIKEGQALEKEEKAEFATRASSTVEKDPIVDIFRREETEYKPVEKEVTYEEVVKPARSVERTIERPVYKEVVPDIKSETNVGDKANKIRQMFRKAEDGTNVYKTLEVGVKTLDTLDEKIDKYKTEIDSFSASAQKNDNMKNAKVKDLKLVENSLEKVDKTAFNELQSVNQSTDEIYMDEANSEFEKIRESLRRLEGIKNGIQDLVNTFDDAKNADLEQVSDFESKVSEINRKKVDVCKLVEEKLRTAVEADKAVAAKRLLEEENRRKEREAQAKEETLQQTLTFGLDSILDKAGLQEEERKVISITSPALDKFTSLRIEDETPTYSGR